MSTAVVAPIVDSRPQKREIEVLKVLAEKVKGKVKWYSVSKCYGFISRSDDGGDLFVHRSVISSCAKRFPSLRNGEEVEFSVVETSQGIEANCVTGPGGQPVKGTWPAYRRQRATSDPNQKSDAQASGTEDGGKNTRVSRRRSNRRSAGADEPKSNETNEQKKDEHENGAAGSPTNQVPRQRRRRKNVRNQSAPTDGDDTVENGNHVHAAEGHGDQRGVRRFRRPFHPRGGMARYPNSNWNACPTSSARNHPSGFYTAVERGSGFRRRNFRGGRYPRGSRPQPSKTTSVIASESGDLVNEVDASQNAGNKGTAEFEDLADGILAADDKAAAVFEDALTQEIYENSTGHPDGDAAALFEDALAQQIYENTTGHPDGDAVALYEDDLAQQIYENSTGHPDGDAAAVFEDALAQEMYKNSTGHPDGDAAAVFEDALTQEICDNTTGHPDFDAVALFEDALAQEMHEDATRTRDLVDIDFVTETMLDAHLND